MVVRPWKAPGPIIPPLCAEVVTGNRYECGIGEVFAHRPEPLILDEPP